ncbi:hypothetical protein WM24_17540 [Burkholderia ubonensis]|uniref:hypothetical protein n=1 Tax=Burkholderia ubonensis TaxID=101571 RepID=UPI00075BF206|nr:hypothetical protein WM24_17540 [Burkholderia ubonensis]
MLLRVLVAVKNRHNVFLPVALALFGGLNVLFHGYAVAGREDLALRATYAKAGRDSQKIRHLLMSPGNTTRILQCEMFT